MRPRVALRLEPAAPLAGRLRDHFAEALRAAWCEAKAAPAAPKSEDLIRAEGALECAYAIENWRMAAPAIRDAEARVSHLRLAA
jgi:hypothetical protein